MSTNVTMPSMGFDMTEGKVSRWLKNIGDTVTRGETIGEIETEKATVDLSAPVDGVFAQILVPPGETVPVNAPIAVITAQGEALPAAAPSAETKPDTSADTQEVQKEEAAPDSATATTEPEAKTPTSAKPSPSKSPEPGSDGDARIKASPVARNMAKQEGIDLKSIKGTGPGGRIIERDVAAALQALKSAAPKPVSTPAPAPAAAAAPAAQLTAGEEPLSKMRQTIARRLVESKSTVPHYYLTIEIGMGEAMKLREQLNAMAASDAERLSVNDLIVAAAAKTLLKFPYVNAYFRGDRISLNAQVNIGIAVSVEDGLLTPVIHDVPSKTLKEIAVESKAAAQRARANKLKPEDLGPGTFTVSNLGMFGIEEFAAIINPPESAILAVGAVRQAPVVVDNSVQITQVMKATLSADHRIVDGAMGARFLQELKKLLENPINLVVG